jgi:hypothetical protein
MPHLAAGEIKVGKLHALLDFEGALTDQKHLRSMGLQLLHSSTGETPRLTFQKVWP